MAYASNPPKPSFSRRALERLVSSAILSLPLLWLTTWPWVAAAGGLLAVALIGADGYGHWTWKYRVRRAFGTSRRTTNPASTLEALFALQSVADEEGEQRNTQPSEAPELAARDGGDQTGLAPSGGPPKGERAADE